MTEERAQPSGTGSAAADDTLHERSRMSFGDHLDELRNCLIRATLGMVLGAIVCLIFGKQILGILCQPLLFVQAVNDLQPRLQTLAPTTAFVAYLKIGFLSGLILAMPWVLYQIWRFVELGLYSHERRFVRSLIPASMGLFVVGVLFLYFIVLPIILQFFISFNKGFGMPELAPTTFQRLLLPERGFSPPVAEESDASELKLRLLKDDPETSADGDAWVNTTTGRLIIKTPTGVLSTPLEPGATSPTMHSQFALDYYISFVLVLALAFGIAFETPIVVFFLAWTRLVPTAKMVSGRRYVLFGAVVMAAMLTPPDVISQLLLAGPMYLLFELGIVVARLTERKVPTEA
jgi:sec-independent protein translocase protein TatC